MLDGRGELSSMPLPSGRKALIQRLEALTGIGAAPPSVSPTAAAPAPDPLAGALLPLLGERLLQLEVCAGRDGRQIALAVVDGPAVERPSLEDALRQRFPGEDAPVLELLDRSAFEALGRLVEAGVLSFTAEGRRLLHRSATQEPDRDARRERWLAAARELLAQAERKIRMAAVLAGGGFPVEALPSLREGVELGLKARSRMEGLDLGDSQEVPAAWIEQRIPSHLPLVRRLRGETESLLGATEEEVRSWISGGERLAQEVEGEMGRMGSPQA